MKVTTNSAVAKGLKYSFLNIIEIENAKSIANSVNINTLKALVRFNDTGIIIASQMTNPNKNLSGTVNFKLIFFDNNRYADLNIINAENIKLNRTEILNMLKDGIRSKGKLKPRQISKNLSQSFFI